MCKFSDTTSEPPHAPLCRCPQCEFAQAVFLLPLVTAMSLLLYYCDRGDLALRQRLLDAACDSLRQSDGGVSP